MLNPWWITLPDLPASCSQCFHLLHSYKGKVLDFQKDTRHHQLQLWIWSLESWSIFRSISTLTPSKCSLSMAGEHSCLRLSHQSTVKLNWFLVKYVIINSLPRHMAKICSAFSSSHTTQEEITLGIFKHSCKLPNIIKVASVTARLKWFELFGFF